jgi:MurNAc alpha-1-phosphate uridylyltransferase
MDNQIDKAFILAAGLGQRMRPVTDKIPKPLVQIAGKSLLHRSINGLDKAGVTDIVINTHHLADQIPEALSSIKRPQIMYSYEPVLLDTAGGIKKMLQHFEGNSFYVLSGDGLWTDQPGKNVLRDMATRWNPEIMDILILLQPVSSMKLTKSVGDYNISPDGRAVRSKTQTGTHMFTSMRINHPQIFKGLQVDCPSSYLPLLDAAEAEGRLFALEHSGDWHHISTPQDLQVVEKAFANHAPAA